MNKNKIPKKIFVIEDDKDISELIETILVGEGFEVEAFTNRKKVESGIKKGKPDLIIMDLWMPGFDGATLTKKIKSKKGKKPCIVLVSAKNALEKTAKSSKADGFLPKPFDLKDLLSIVRKFTK